MFKLAALSPAPKGRRPTIRQARRYLEATHDSVSGLLDSFNLVREETAKVKGTAAGRLSRDQVDLLRAALVFTSSGLDASCQALVTLCAPALINKGGAARTRFDLFLDQQMKTPSEALVTAVKAIDPRKALIDLYVDTKTKASYQGSGDLKDRVRDLLGIPNAAIPNKRIEALDGFFTARNDIVHRLDYVSATSTSRARNSRAAAAVVSECDRVLALVSDLIAATASLL